MPQLLDTLCIISGFLHKEKEVRGTRQIKHNDWRQQNNLCTFWEDTLNEGKGQGDHERSSSDEKQKKLALRQGIYSKVLRSSFWIRAGIRCAKSSVALCTKFCWIYWNFNLCIFINTKAFESLQNYSTRLLPAAKCFNSLWELCISFLNTHEVNTDLDLNLTFPTLV